MKMLEQWYNKIMIPEAHQFRDMLREMDQYAEVVPYDITNVVASMAAASNDHKFTEKDYPIISPPYPVLWMEFRVPSSYKTPGSKIVYAGAFILSTRLDKPAILGTNDPMQPILTRTAELTKQPNPHTPARRHGLILKHDLQNTTVTHIQSWSYFVSTRDECLELGSSMNYVNDKGGYVPYLDVALSREDFTHHGFATVQVPVLMAIALTHAKNVKAVDQPVIAEIKDRRRREKKNYFIFKELVIKPTSTRAPSTNPDERPDKEGYTRAFHMRAGQWKDYTQGKGLFGKHHGLYWWEPHAAGSLKQGAVVKSYRIKRS